MDNELRAVLNRTSLQGRLNEVSHKTSQAGSHTMKPNLNAGFAGLLGLATARLVFDLADWSYNSFRDPFDLGKMVVRLGVPIAATMIWFWIFQAAFKTRNQ